MFHDASPDALGHALSELGFRLCTEDVVDLFSMVTVKASSATVAGPDVAAYATPPEGIRSGGEHCTRYSGNGNGTSLYK